jgi:hypothetical protein
MARINVPVQTQLCFHTFGNFAPPADLLGTPETVGIQFEGREVVWHALGSSEPFLREPSYPYAPTVTALMTTADTDDELFALILRFCSAVSYEFEAGIGVDRHGGDGEPDAFHPAVSRQAKATIGGLIVPAPKAIAVANEDRLRLALALYREALSVSSSYFAFVGFWSVVQAVHNGDERAVDAFFNQETAGVASVANYVASVLQQKSRQPLPTDFATHFRDGRDAIAHVIRYHGNMTHINPDEPGDRLRLDADIWFLRALARRAIDTAWPNAVTVVPRD